MSQTPVEIPAESPDPILHALLHFLGQLKALELVRLHVPVELVHEPLVHRLADRCALHSFYLALELCLRDPKLMSEWYSLHTSGAGPHLLADEQYQELAESLRRLHDQRAQHLQEQEGVQSNG